jgi:hypothetical protein
MYRAQSGSTLGGDPPLDGWAAAADRASRDAESSHHEIAAHTTASACPRSRGPLSLAPGASKPQPPRASDVASRRTSLRDTRNRVVCGARSVAAGCVLEAVSEGQEVVGEFWWLVDVEVDAEHCEAEREPGEVVVARLVATALSVD